VYGDLSRAAANVLKRLSESGVSNSTAPDADELQLEWVHGYRGFDCRNNVFYVEPRKAAAAGSGACVPSNTVLCVMDDVVSQPPFHPLRQAQFHRVSFHYF
jgi:hypothetical protein